MSILKLESSLKYIDELNVNIMSFIQKKLLSKSLESIADDEPIQSQYSQYILPSCILFCVTFAIIYTNRHKSRTELINIVKLLIFIGWLIDFIFTWQKLYQISEIDRYVAELTSESAEIRRNMLSGSLWTIGPLDVLSEQITVLSGRILIPVKHIGSALMACYNRYLFSFVG